MKSLHRTVIYLVVTAALLACTASGFCQSFGSPPGEGQGGLIYGVTHLHPIAYVTLFLIFALAVMNLVFRRTSAIKSVRPLLDKLGAGNGLPTRRDAGASGQRRSGTAKSGKRASRTAGQPAPIREVPQGSGAEAVGHVRKIVKEAGVEGETTSTPLDGINHEMPSFVTRLGEPRPAPPDTESQPEDRRPKREFKFSSAVDLPSQEELERREKEKVVVSGVVRGPDGAGLPSVLVYLTDEEGARVGQSARSCEHTGEFKVQVNQPGKYALNGYKRGYIIDSAEPKALPILSGKIEGFDFTMIPEGCLVQGSLSFEGSGAESDGNIEIRCVCENDGSFRSEKLKAGAGPFRIWGVPRETLCHLEAVSPEGEVLTRSEAFDTGQSNHISRQLKVRSQTLETDDIAQSEDESEVASWNKQEEEAEETSVSQSFSGPPNQS